MTQQYGHGFKAIRYTGSKTDKEYLGYIFAATGSIIAMRYEDAVKALTHSDVFEEAGIEPLAVSFAAAAGGANVCEVTITVKDANDEAVDNGVVVFDTWLSDDAKGSGLTSTGASGTVQPKSAEGTELVEHTAKKHLTVHTKKDTGTFVLEITDTSKTGFYVCAKISGITYVSDQLVTGDYGS